MKSNLKEVPTGSPVHSCAMGYSGKIAAIDREGALDSLAEVAIQVGLGLVEGQALVVTAPTEALPLVRRVAEHAYMAGATQVIPLFSDDEMMLARFRHASDASLDDAPDWLFEGLAKALAGGAARLTIAGGDPVLLSGQSPARVARARMAFAKASRPVMELMRAVATNWTTIAYVTAPWAAKVFPDLPEELAMAELWDAVFRASRVDGADAVEGWRAHARDLEERAAFLDRQHYASLHFRGPGTDLRVGLMSGHRWRGGAATSKNGIVCSPNIPSEEVFTAPDRGSVDGHVTLTRPLSLQGTIVEGVELTFSEGELSHVEARQGAELLRAIVGSDEGARRLGEVGLVPASSAVAKTGLLFCNTLFDENAGSHAALGQSFDACVEGGDRLGTAELLARGANQSAIHIDCVIGSEQVDVDAETADGRHERVMEKGEWVAGVS